MLELSGRVERIAAVGGAQQITGQAQVKFFNRITFFQRFILLGYGWCDSECSC